MTADPSIGRLPRYGPPRAWRPCVVFAYSSCCCVLRACPARRGRRTLLLRAVTYEYARVASKKGFACVLITVNAGRRTARVLLLGDRRDLLSTVRSVQIAVCYTVLLFLMHAYRQETREDGSVLFL